MLYLKKKIAVPETNIIQKPTFYFAGTSSASFHIADLLNFRQLHWLQLCEFPLCYSKTQ